MLDWKIIIEKYEDAWHEWFDFLCNYNMHSGDKWCIDDKEFINSPWESQVGWYYKFFEEKEIFISIDACEIKYGGCQNCYGFGGYTYELMGKDYGDLYYSFREDGDDTIMNEKHWSKYEYKYKTRKEIEINAITKSFYFLQEKIDKNDPVKIRERRERKLSTILNEKK